MIFKRPSDFQLIIDPAADYQATLIALALAAQMEKATTLERVEETLHVKRALRFLESGGVTADWDGRSVTIDPAVKKPFAFVETDLDYDLLSFMLALAATRAGSRVAIVDGVDNTIEMIILALRRLGAELEFVSGTPDQMVVHQPVNHRIKYQLTKESAKITPQLLVAQAGVDGKGEIADLFAEGRFDYIFSHSLAGFRRQLLTEPEADDELQRRLCKQKPVTREHNSRIILEGKLMDEDSSLRLHPDVEFAAFLAAGVISNPGGKLILRGFADSDLTNTPLAQLKRMGAQFERLRDDDTCGFLVSHSQLKPRKMTYEQLHAYPDAVGALALANATLDVTTVIRSARYSTEREEERRRRLCEVMESLGVRVGAISDGIVLEGKSELTAEPIKGADDPITILTAVAASLGPVSQIEIDDYSAAAARWGESFRTLLGLYK
ncbi:MAG: hypothetical protein KAT58_06730 [candidate division Zixibacteria bacterium]|nr:hypothetical protein [candidate division Zixibacteria bacterium]